MIAHTEAKFRCRDGVWLSYSSTGEGFPVICVNGGGNLKDGWAGTTSSFSRYFRVICYNQRNQGREVAGHGSGYLMSQHVEDLACLVEQAEIESFAGVGPSTGARILTDYADCHPERVRGLVLVGFATDNLRHRNGLIFASWVNALRSCTDDDLRCYVEAYLPWIHGPDYLSRTAPPVEQIAQGVLRLMTKAGLIANVLATQNSLALSIPRSNLNMPVLILQGEYDLIAPPTCLAGLDCRFSDLRLKVLSRRGHNLRAEDRAAFERFTLDFLVDELKL